MNLNMGILGRKIGMTQVYDENGVAVPVTAVEAGPCTVLQVKTPDKEGYASIQIGFSDTPPRNVPEDILKKAQGRQGEYDVRYGRVPRAMRRRFFKAETAPKRFVREVRLSTEAVAEFSVGQELKADVLAAGDWVDVIGTSKGRGFTGVVKRHGFTMFGKTHGTHEWRRHAGSIGSRKPQHTRRGTRMAGQHGNRRVTVQNLLVHAVRPEENLVLIRGAVPGPNGGFVVVRKARKKS